jgi:endoglucanase
VEWYGAESTDFVVGGLQLEPLDEIVEHIVCLGFNAVRLPWSNEMYESNPIVPDYTVTANPQLKGLRALAVYDRVVRALAARGVLVILDNHNSNAEWCCGDDGNDLWYNADYPETSWIADWTGMVKRYRDEPLVVAADLRNEPRVDATWGVDPATDWHAAAQRGGNAVLSVNSKLLIMVEGVNYALDLTGVGNLPVHLNVANKLVYSPHDYPFDHDGITDAADLASALNSAWVISPHPGNLIQLPSGWANSATVIRHQSASRIRQPRMAPAGCGSQVSGNIFRRMTLAGRGGRLMEPRPPETDELMGARRPTAC